MTNISNPMVERIRKLLELSKSDNPNEAAAAAAKAAELMAKHEIDAAVVAASEKGEAAIPEDIIEVHLPGTEDYSKVVGWRTILAHGIGDGVGVETWTAGGKIEAMGTRSKIGAWQYLCLYLANEVDRLADEGWNGDAGELARWNDVPARRWKNAFRVGAARVIAKRLKEQAAASLAQRKTNAMTAAMGQLATATTALAIIDRDAERLAKQYADRSKHFAKGTPIGQVSSHGGYMAGKRAGAEVNLAGGGRGLPAPAKQVKGGSDRDVADRCGVPQADVGRWKAGTLVPEQKAWRRLCEMVSRALYAHQALYSEARAEQQAEQDLALRGLQRMTRPTRQRRKDFVREFLKTRPHAPAGGADGIVAAVRRTFGVGIDPGAIELIRMELGQEAIRASAPLLHNRRRRPLNLGRCTRPRWWRPWSSWSIRSRGCVA